MFARSGKLVSSPAKSEHSLQPTPFHYALQEEGVVLTYYLDEQSPEQTIAHGLRKRKEATLNEKECQWNIRLKFEQACDVNVRTRAFEI